MAACWNREAERRCGFILLSVRVVEAVKLVVNCYWQLQMREECFMDCCWLSADGVVVVVCF